MYLVVAARPRGIRGRQCRARSMGGEACGVRKGIERCSRRARRGARTWRRAQKCVGCVTWRGRKGWAREARWVRSAPDRACSAAAGGYGKERCMREPRAGRAHTPLRPRATRRDRGPFDTRGGKRAACDRTGGGTDVPPSGRYRRAVQACTLETRFCRRRSFRSGVGCTQSYNYIRDTWGSGTLRRRSGIRMRETQEIRRCAGHIIVESVKSRPRASCTPGRGPRRVMYHQRRCVASQRGQASRYWRERSWCTKKWVSDERH
jgi:hypothetical protein